MAIADSISYPTSPITPPAAADADFDVGTETRPRRSTVSALRRKDLYSLFPDSDGLFNLAVKFASSDEWGSDPDSSGETTPMSETRPTSRTMAAPPPLPMYLKEEVDGKKSVMERIDEDHPSPPSPLEEPRKRASSADGLLDMIKLKPSDGLGLPLFALPTEAPRSPTSPPAPQLPPQLPSTPTPAPQTPHPQQWPQQPPQTVFQPSTAPAAAPPLMMPAAAPQLMLPPQQPMMQPPQMPAAAPMMAPMMVQLANGQQMQVFVPVQTQQQPSPPQQWAQPQQQWGMQQMPMQQMQPPMMAQEPHWAMQPGMPPLPPQLSPQQMMGVGSGPSPMATDSPSRWEAQQPQQQQPQQQHWLQPGSLAHQARDAKGSRRLQGELSRMSAAQLQQVGDELRSEIFELSKHPFGNYLVSRMAAMPPLQSAVAHGLKGHIVELVTHVQGSRVVQAALNALDDASAAMLAEELRGHVMRCSVDTYGSWGVCVAFERCLPAWMLHEVASQLEQLAMQQQACHVVQSVLKVAASRGLDLSGAIDALLRAPTLPQLAAHPFANYAVQIALRHAAPPQRAMLVARLLPTLLTLASSKHGSNVAETLLGQADAAQLNEAARIVLAAGSAGGVPSLVESQFGNYVLQTLLRLLQPDARAQVLAAVRAAATETNYARLILSRFGDAEPQPTSPEF